MNAPKAWSCGEASGALTMLAKKFIRTCSWMDRPELTFWPIHRTCMQAFTYMEACSTVFMLLWVTGLYLWEELMFRNCPFNLLLLSLLGIPLLSLPLQSDVHGTLCPLPSPKPIPHLSVKCHFYFSILVSWVFIPTKGTPPQPHMLPFPQPNYSSYLNRYFSKDMANKQWKDAQHH